MSSKPCTSCGDPTHALNQICGTCWSSYPGLGISIPLPKKCSDCKKEVLLVSENGTDNCDTWRCIPCCIKYEVKIEVTRVLKDLGFRMAEH